MSQFRLDMVDAFRNLNFAHRGLHRPGSKYEENTLAAIGAALDRGFGIEIDARATLDDQVVVFHDAHLDRMTHVKGPVIGRGVRELTDIHVLDSGQTIPSLYQALDLVGGQVPILIDVKKSRDDNIRRYGTALRRAVEGYNGPFAFVCFDHELVAWFKHFWPNIPCGLVIGPAEMASFRDRFRLRRFIKNIQPDVLAVHTKLADTKLVKNCRRKGMLVLSWTVRDQETASRLRPHVDGLIFDDPGLLELN